MHSAQPSPSGTTRLIASRCVQRTVRALMVGVARWYGSGADEAQPEPGVEQYLVTKDEELDRGHGARKAHFGPVFMSRA